MPSLRQEFRGPEIEGWACLQNLFPNWETAWNRAATLGFEIKHLHGTPWKYVKAADLVKLLDSSRQSDREVQAARTVDQDWISCRILADERRPDFSTKFFAEQLGLEVRKPSSAEDEAFVRIDDLHAICAKAAEAGWSVSPDTAERVVAWIREHHAAGQTARKWAKDERDRKAGRIPDDRPHWLR